MAYTRQVHIEDEQARVLTPHGTMVIVDGNNITIETTLGFRYKLEDRDGFLYVNDKRAHRSNGP